MGSSSGLWAVAPQPSTTCPTATGRSTSIMPFTYPQLPKDYEFNFVRLESLLRHIERKKAGQYFEKVEKLRLRQRLLRAKRRLERNAAERAPKRACDASCERASKRSKEDDEAKQERPPPPGKAGSVSESPGADQHVITIKRDPSIEVGGSKIIQRPPPPGKAGSVSESPGADQHVITIKRDPSIEVGGSKIIRPYHLKILLPDIAVDKIIGKGVDGLVQLENATDTKITIAKPGDYFPGTKERACMISGELIGIMQAIDHISYYIIQQIPTAEQYQSLQSCYIEFNILIEATKVGMLIGREGCNLRRLKYESGAYIFVSGDKYESVERCVTISGDMITSRIASWMILNEMDLEVKNRQFLNVSYTKKDCKSSGTSEQGSSDLPTVQMPSKQLSSNIPTVPMSSNQGSSNISTELMPSRQGSSNISTVPMPFQQECSNISTLTMHSKQRSSNISTEPISSGQQGSKISAVTMHTKQRSSNISTVTISSKQGSSNISTELMPSIPGSSNISTVPMPFQKESSNISTLTMHSKQRSSNISAVPISSGQQCSKISAVTMHTKERSSNISSVPMSSKQGSSNIFTAPMPTKQWISNIFTVPMPSKQGSSNISTEFNPFGEGTSNEYNKYSSAEQGSSKKNNEWKPHAEQSITIRKSISNASKEACPTNSTHYHNTPPSCPNIMAISPSSIINSNNVVSTSDLRPRQRKCNLPKLVDQYSSNTSNLLGGFGQGSSSSSNVSNPVEQGSSVIYNALRSTVQESFNILKTASNDSAATCPTNSTHTDNNPPSCPKIVATSRISLNDSDNVDSTSDLGLRQRKSNVPKLDVQDSSNTPNFFRFFGQGSSSSSNASSHAEQGSSIIYNTIRPTGNESFDIVKTTSNDSEATCSTNTTHNNNIQPSCPKMVAISYTSLNDSDNVVSTSDLGSGERNFNESKLDDQESPNTPNLLRFFGQGISSFSNVSSPAEQGISKVYNVIRPPQNQGSSNKYNILTSAQQDSSNVPILARLFRHGSSNISNVLRTAEEGSSNISNVARTAEEGSSNRNNELTPAQRGIFNNDNESIPARQGNSNNNNISGIGEEGSSTSTNVPTNVQQRSSTSNNVPTNVQQRSSTSTNVATTVGRRHSNYSNIGMRIDHDYANQLRGITVENDMNSLEDLFAVGLEKVGFRATVILNFNKVYIPKGKDLLFIDLMIKRAFPATAFPDDKRTEILRSVEVLKRYNMLGVLWKPEEHIRWRPDIPRLERPVGLMRPDNAYNGLPLDRGGEPVYTRHRQCLVYISLPETMLGLIFSGSNSVEQIKETYATNIYGSTEIVYMDKQKYRVLKIEGSIEGVQQVEHIISEIVKRGLLAESSDDQPQTKKIRKQQGQ